MHGAGSRENDINSVITNPFFLLTEKHEKFPFITVAPQCNEDSWFDVITVLKEFVCEVVSFDFTDSKRVYAMGASMGGYAVWQLAMCMPDVFAAIVPICGGGMYWNAARLVNVNIWAFHGGIDTVVYPEESKKMVSKVNDTGGNARLTVYRDVGHNSWTATYLNYEVFEWLLKFKNNNIREIKAIYNNSESFG